MISDRENKEITAIYKKDTLLPTITPYMTTRLIVKKLM